MISNGFDAEVARCTNVNEREYWDGIFTNEDPWNYQNAYEQTKYQHTLEMLPESPIANATELGCAEGVFTEMLAPRVGSLLAIDVSDKALDRARVRCAGINNVKFEQHDIWNGIIGSDWDLIVCSEILYYCRDGAALREAAQKIREALKVGGHLLMTHPNMVSDDKSNTGFDFNEIGSKFIAQIFSAIEDLQYVRELRTELYTVQLFRRSAEARAPDELPVACPREVLLRKNAEFEDQSIKWGGCIITASEARHCWVTTKVPILMYHRIATSGAVGLAPYRTSPASFERQLAWLQRQGYHAISLQTYYESFFEKRVDSIAGKPIILTFDDAYLDFYYNAWPLLRKYGFGATVFVPTDFVGGKADWDIGHGLAAQLMSWEQIIELNERGIDIGSHGRAHRILTDLNSSAIFSDAIDSKKLLETKLRHPISGYSYPWAVSDANSEQIIKSAGYRYAVGVRKDDSPGPENPFYIPRIEIFGSDTIDDFIAKIPKPQCAEEAVRLKYYELRSRRDRSTYMPALRS
jgi:peptidoglycan/xylan/chitin deacetylase (PgdA/CDA1 family)/2-polyprenyl-3-methyl-5-hydroxy-6-metoxy-1,4-benzoquinol methylase